MAFYQQPRWASINAIIGVIFCLIFVFIICAGLLVRVWSFYGFSSLEFLLLSRTDKFVLLIQWLLLHFVFLLVGNDMQAAILVWRNVRQEVESPIATHWALTLRNIVIACIILAVFNSLWVGRFTSIGFGIIVYGSFVYIFVHCAQKLKEYIHTDDDVTVGQYIKLVDSV